jgi:hypothetical protein
MNASKTETREEDQQAACSSVPSEPLGEKTARNTNPCTACGGGDDEGEILLCDECDGAYHMSCVGFEGSLQGDWFCPSCE